MNPVLRQCVQHILLWSIVAVCFFIADGAFAQTVVGGSGTTDFGVTAVDESIALESTNIIVLILNIIRVVIGLLGIIALGLILYAGFVWMTSQGAEDKIAIAKRTLINATIGLAIIMSAFAIVQFVISALSDATGVPRGPGSGGASPVVLSFAGSGALGEAILDHYPFRFAQDVPRNTKIAITFRESLDPATVIVNSNNTCVGGGGTVVDCGAPGADTTRPVYGDCLTPSAGGSGAFDWQALCDSLVTSSIAIRPTDAEADVPAIGAAVLAQYEDTAFTDIRTISIRPYEPLGSSIENIWYTVQLSNDIDNRAGESVFRASRSPYRWEFQTDTVLDTAPPVVTSVYPVAGATISKNTIISVTFSEPMDPVAVQGIINSGANPFTNLLFDTTDIDGQWRVTNGYRTVEFVPSTPCDVVNSCGEVMYCLPVAGCASPTDTGCVDPYTTLVRTARRITDESWESFPFTGVTDISGNALDGNADGVRAPFPPRPTVLSELSDTERVPDNAYWQFSVVNDIDRRVPYPYQISPGVDQEQVRGDIPLTVLFSMPMFINTLYQIDIEEYPETEFEFWKHPISESVIIPSTVFGNPTPATKVTVRHREFGPDNRDLYYFTTIGGGVRGVNQNCLYPGVGPAAVTGAPANTTCVLAADGTPGATCVDVTVAESNDTGCAYTNLSVDTHDQSLASTADCLEVLREDAITTDS